MTASARRIVVMGVAGAGKTTVGRALADALGATFRDADDDHPAANREKMAAGVPLTDEDRAPWLAMLATRLADARTEGRALVLACSALRRAYRDVLRGGDPDAIFVHLHADPSTIAPRLADRRGHFMPASLLASQLATLEPLSPDEGGVTVSAAEAPDTIVRTVRAALDAPRGA